MLVSGIGGMRAQEYTNQPVRTWDLRQWSEVSVNYASSQGMTLSDYDNKSYIHSQYGLHLRGQSLSFWVSSGQIVSLTVTNFDDSGKYTAKAKMTLGETVVYCNTAKGTGQTATAYLTANGDGNVTISGNGSPSNTYITSISIENAPNVSFSSSSCEAELINLGFNEPVLRYPAPSSVTYSVSNTKIAKLGGEGGSGDIMTLNTGITTVSANVTYKGGTYTTSYTLTVKADDATYEVNGNTYTLTGPGKLQERVVTLIPKINMEFGTQDVVNTTIVRNESDAGIVGTTIDSEGWRTFSFTTQDKRIVPSEGTFYTFKPQSSGKLTVRGVIHNKNNAYIVDAANLAPMPSNITGIVGTNEIAWNGTGQAAAGVTAPITTSDGREALFAERYEYNANGTGIMLHQTITGLPAGKYYVKIAANSCFTPDRGFESDVTELATDVAYVYVQNSQQRVQAHIGGTTGTIYQTFEFDEVEVGSNGELTMGLGKDKAGTNWHTIQIMELRYKDALTDSWQPIETINYAGESGTIETTVDVTAGHTYYLYGNIPASNGLSEWATYQLKSFTFESNFHYPLKSVVLERGAKSGGQKVVGSGNPTFRMELKGDITDATLNSDGTVSNIQGDGGAIVVYAKEGNDEIYYVITVPYTEKVWDFKANCYNEEKQGLDKTKEWAVNYEVRTYDEVTRNLIYLNNPVLTADEALEGNNAAFIGETAGLVVNATAKSFGLSADGVNYGDFAAFKAFFLENAENRAKYADYINTYGLNESMTEAQFEELKKDGAFVDVYLKLMLNFTKAEITENSTNVGAMQKGAVLTLPKMKAGEYVAIKWFRHGGDQGDNIKVTNLTDLDGTPISQNVLVINQNNLKGTVQPIIDCPYGWLEFKVAQDGDVTFEVDDRGWTHIKAIAISPEFIDTDLRLVVGVETAPATYTHDGSGVEIHFNATDQSSCQPQRQEAFYKVMFSYEDASPTLTGINIQNQVERGATYTGEPEKNGKGQTNVFKDAIFTAQGHGTVVIVQKAVTDADHGNYVIDIEKTRITIIEGGDTHQDYPYTWDFTNISDETKNKLTPANGWAQNSDGSYTPNETGQQNYVQNTELENGAGDDVAEYDGLGFLTSTSDGYSPGISNISIAPEGDDAGLKIGNNETTTVVVPDVPEGCTVFVRVEPKGENSVISSNGEPLVPTNRNVDGTGENLYEIPVERDPESDGSNKTDVPLELKDVTVKGIAVTNLWKECSFWDETEEHTDGAEETGYYCYNSDSHDKPIKYSLTQYYTNVFMKALTVKSTNSENNTVEVADIDYTPAYTGVIVYSIDKGIDHPLFVPAVNDQKSKAEDEAIKAVSMMIPHVESGEVAASDGDSIRYVFTNVYNKVSDVGTKISANTPGFYQVNRAGVLKANRAYLVLPKETPAGVKAMKLYTLSYTGNEEEDPTAINGIDATIDLNGEFYTISGVKLQGVPTQKGIYIQNGKKVMIK